MGVQTTITPCFEVSGGMVEGAPFFFKIVLNYT